MSNVHVHLHLRNLGAGRAFYCVPVTQIGERP